MTYNQNNDSTLHNLMLEQNRLIEKTQKTVVVVIRKLEELIDQNDEKVEQRLNIRKVLAKEGIEPIEAE